MRRSTWTRATRAIFSRASASRTPSAESRVGSTARRGPADSRRRGPASTTSRFCSRRSTRTERYCRSSARRSSTSVAGPQTGSARATAGCRRTASASVSPIATTTACRSRSRPVTTPRRSSLRRYLVAAQVEARDLLGLNPDLLPHGKCDVNSIGPFSLNLLDGSNRAYPDGDAATRARVREHHLDYTRSFLYFLANDDDVPAHIRAELGRWGLCADEFEDTGGWPHQLYVRDGRRMLGEHVLTEHDLLDARPQPDEVARGSYNIDIREVERTWRYLPEYDRQAAVFNEGYLSVAVPAYPIPYRALTPRREQSVNLLVPVCLSASHVAFGSLRMEPTLMVLGHAAGTAAAESARRGCAVQDVEVAALQLLLRDEGQVLQ